MEILTIKGAEMTNEEAIKILTQYIDYGAETPDYYEMEKACHIAIKTVDRDIPKRVKIEQWIATKCPNGCGYVLSTHHGDGYYSIENKPTFCPLCGQRLDWRKNKK